MRTVATVFCGSCRDDKRRQPTKLGEVQGEPLGEVVELPARLMWHGYDEPSAEKLRKYDGRGEPPESRHYWVELTADSPEHLPVWCRNHGPGSVSSAEVISGVSTTGANGKRRKLFLEVTRGAR